VSPDDGMIRATVIGVADPLGLGRVLIRLPDGISETEVWARVASSSPGAREAVFQPEVSDEVLVAFAGGDQRSPIVVGSLWQGGSPPPTQADTNPVRRPPGPLIPSRKVK
jgi:uncharacterized protein involved in type VI secretion and phage assembly